jgi:hypothetical protein
MLNVLIKYLFIFYFFFLYINSNMNQNLIKLILLVLLLVIVYRLHTSTNNIETFDNQQLGQPKANLIQVIRVKHNPDDNSYDLMFDNKYNLKHIHIKTNVLNSNPNYVVYYLDDDNNYSENFVLDNDEMQHLNKPEGNFGNLITSKPKIRGNQTVSTSSIKVKLLSGDNFDINRYYIYGLSKNNTLINSGVTNKLTITNTEMNMDPNTGKHVHKLGLDKEYSVRGIEFTYTIENHNVDSNQNRSFPFDIHYSSKLSDGKTATYRLNDPYYTSDFELTNDGFKSTVYLNKEIITDKLFLSIPRKIVLNGNEHSILQVGNFSAIVNSSENFSNTNSESKTNSKNREDFQSVGEYSPDELCPSLSGIENQMKLADTICERIEYNDKIKNERLKLERNKQYILKLKSQDEEIEKLEQIIKEIQSKRENRDTYNDALRLAQLQEQRKKSATIKELAKKRVDHKNNNQLHVELNLVDEAPFNPL